MSDSVSALSADVERHPQVIKLLVDLDINVTKLNEKGKAVDKPRPLSLALNDLVAAHSSGARPRCLQPWQSLMIDVTGKVQPCAYRGNYTNTENAEPFGNINLQPLEEIWNGPVARRVRRCMAAGDLAGAGCGKCLAVSQGQDLGLEYDPRAQERPETDYSVNIATKISDILAGTEVSRSHPTVLYYTPDHRCNLACVHCYQNISRKDSIQRKSASDEILLLVPYLSDVVAGGGEPLILPLWRRFLASPARTQNPYLRFSTTTNATVLREDVFDQLKAFDRISIIISLDGASQGTFETIRHRANWERFLVNARRLRSLCSDKNAFFSFNISTMKGNILELPKFVELCTQFEAPFNYQPVVAYPAAQSLRCFNDPHNEMAGWREALAGAKRLLDERFFPAMQKAGKEGRAAWLDAYNEVYQGHVTALNGLIPWFLLDEDHHRYAGCLPIEFRERINFLESVISTVRKGGEGSVLLFFKASDAPGAEPHYYADLDRDFRFSVSLPNGTYYLKSAPKDFPLGTRAEVWTDIAITVRNGTMNMFDPAGIRRPLKRLVSRLRQSFQAIRAKL